MLTIRCGSTAYRAARIPWRRLGIQRRASHRRWVLVAVATIDPRGLHVAPVLSRRVPPVGVLVTLRDACVRGAL